jgi:spermidine synthase
MVIVYGACLLSGVSALVYEVVWMRLLSLVFGNTTYAVSLVLAAFMAGLGLGSLFVGRRADRFSNPLRTFALLEGGIAVFAALAPYIIKGVGLLYALGMKRFDLAPSPVLQCTRFAVPFILLLFPTVLMGGTLPVLSRATIVRRDRMGTGIGLLYGLNTLGASLGAVATGFALIYTFGVLGSNLLAVLVNLVIAGVFLLISRGEQMTARGTSEAALQEAKQVKAGVAGRTTDPSGREEHPRTPSVGSQSVHPSVVLGVMAASGFAALGYEVVWTRALAFFIGSTTYAFSTMLATFLFGLVLGSLAVARFSDRIRNLPALLGGTEFAVGLSALASVPVLSTLFYRLFPETGPGWTLPAGLKFGYAFSVMILPTFLLGAVLPIAVKIYGSTRAKASSFRPARSVGDVTAANTFGCIAGALVSGFVLIPGLGIQKSLVALVVIHFAAGLLLLALSPMRTRTAERKQKQRKAKKRKERRVRRSRMPATRWIIIPSLVALAAISFIILPSRERAFSVLHRYASIHGESIYYEEGLSSIVEVIQRPSGARDLYIDGELNASTSRTGMRVHRLLAQLPVLLHPDPHDVFHVALGSGMTAGATRPFDNLASVDCAEISSDVVRAATLFDIESHHVLNWQKFNLVIEDGRNYLLRTPETYDVMVTGIIHPKYNAGNAGLYGLDYYELCKSKLKPGGILCQWAPLNALSEEEYRMIIRTFLNAFPHTSLWFVEPFGRVSSINTLLIGSTDPMSINYTILSRRMEKIKDDLAAAGIDDPSDLLQCYVAGRDRLAEHTGQSPSPVITDNRPILEFGPIVNDYPRTLESLLNIREHVTSLIDFSSEDTLMRPDQPERSEIIQDLDNRFDAMGTLIQGDLKLMERDLKGAVALYEEAFTILPDHPPLRRELTELKISLGSFYDEHGDIQRAIAELEGAVRLRPDHGIAQYTLGLFYQKAGMSEKAVQAYQQAVSANPKDFRAMANLGYMYSQEGDREKAIEMYEKALRISPGNEVILQYLAQLKVRQPE